MLESFIDEGRQEIGPAMRHGVSVTDACVGIADTAEIVADLAAAVRRRSLLTVGSSRP